MPIVPANPPRRAPRALAHCAQLRSSARSRSAPALPGWPARPDCSPARRESRFHRQFDNLAAEGFRDIRHLHDAAPAYGAAGALANLVAMRSRSASSSVTPGRSLTNSSTCSSPPWRWPQARLSALLPPARLAGRFPPCRCARRRVEHCVRAAVDHHAVVRGQLGKIAMAPDIGKAGK